MDLRAYARAKEVYDSTPMEKRPKNELINKVREIMFDLAREKIDRINKDGQI